MSQDARPPVTRRRFGAWSTAMLAAGLGAGPRMARADEATAAPWPTLPGRPVRLIVVYPPGGVSDAMARALAQQLQPLLGVPVVTENRPGAGGRVGMDLLGRAPPDGHTLAFSAISPLTLAAPAARSAQPALSGSSAPVSGATTAAVPAIPVIPVIPVAPVMRTPVLVVGTPAFTGRDFADVIAQAREHPGDLRWATSGRATIGHLVLAQVRRQSGVSIVHVPYQGGGPQLNDALGGQFELLSTNVAALQLQYLAEGRLQALAVGAPRRLAALPGVPTLAELGFAQANLQSLFGVFAPGGTPSSVVDTLNRAVRQALGTAAMQARLRQAYNLPAEGSADGFAREIAADRERQRALLGAAPGLLD